MKSIDENDVGMSVKEAARILGVSMRTVYRLCEDGVLQHYRIGRRVTITPAQIQKYRKYHAQPQNNSDLWEHLR